MTLWVSNFNSHFTEENWSVKFRWLVQSLIDNTWKGPDANPSLSGSQAQFLTTAYSLFLPAEYEPFPWQVLEIAPEGRTVGFAGPA